MYNKPGSQENARAMISPADLEELHTEYLPLNLLRGNYTWSDEGRLLLFVDDHNAKQHPFD